MCFFFWGFSLGLNGEKAGNIFTLFNYRQCCSGQDHCSLDAQNNHGLF